MAEGIVVGVGQFVELRKYGGKASVKTKSATSIWKSTLVTQLPDYWPG